jgi:hypothetical protein
MEFLRSEVVSSVTKVNHVKFTIKADVCLDNLFCSVKMRVYKIDLGQYKVELQRRSGDSIAVSRLHSMMSKYLKSATPVNQASLLQQSHDSTGFDSNQGRPANIDAENSTLPLPLAGDSKLDLAPLLYLASDSQDVALQAEGVSALAQAAQDSAAAQLCTPEVFALLQRLAQVVNFSIAESLFRITCSLAVLPQAHQHSDFFSLHKSLKESRCAARLRF